jgi:zinc protease
VIRSRYKSPERTAIHTSFVSDTIMRSIQLSAAVFIVLFACAMTARAEIPPHPGDLVFPPLDFTPPAASDYRRELPGGVPVYLAPSREFPLIEITFAFRGGSYLDPPDQVGLGDALGSMMRRGGTMTVPAEEMDERFDFLAAEVRSSVGAEQSSASINCLKSNLGEAFALFMDMIRNPGFDADRLRVYKDEVIEDLKQRNDRPMSVAMLNLSELMFGADHYAGRQPTKASVESITPDGLRALHGRIFHPGNLIIAVTGDFESDEMLAYLAGVVEGWPVGEEVEDPPAPERSPVPGLYHADAAQKDLPQGTTVIVTRTVRRDHPDMIALQVMNHILGGGGFTSRITRRVRSDEGLAYTAASFIQPQVYYPGMLSAFFMTSNSTVAFATSIVFEEIERIRTEPVGDEELALARNAFIERLPQQFASKERMLRLFVDDELTGRDPAYWRDYRDNFGSVTAEDVLRVARRYLVPDEMIVLVVGPWDEIKDGDLEGRARMSDFFEGRVTHLPMRDPLTLKPIAQR